jgi:glutathione S-transferase
MPDRMRLITIPMSHYCEKARWALERLDIPYHEERHLQIFHYPRTWWTSRGRTVPVLIDGGRVFADSTDILKHLDSYAGPGRTLYPESMEERARIEQLEDLFDEVVGVESRRWVYFQYRNRPLQAIRVAGQGAPWYEILLMPFIYPLFRFVIGKVLDPTAANVDAGLDKVREVLKRTDAWLAEGGPYLLGSRFTAADLTLACMLAPLVSPPNYGIRLPALKEMPLAARSAVEEFRATRTGQYVLHLYDTQRVPRAALKL